MKPSSLEYFEEPARSIDPYDPMCRNHWETSDPHILKTRTYKGHLLALRNPFQFWVVAGREDGKPLHASLQSNSFTDLSFAMSHVDEAIKAELKAIEERKS
jgi:hypothetical protein